MLIMTTLRGSIRWLVGVVLLLPALAGAQTNVGQISGRVTDQSGGALPGVSLTATNEQTGLAQTVTSDGSGSYVFASLPAGPYKVKAELTGFKPFERVHLVLDAASRRTADFQLEVGNVTETVSVAAVTSQVGAWS